MTNQSNTINIQSLQYIKKCFPPSPIYFNPYPSIWNNPNKKADSLKANIKTQPGETDINTILLYVLIFNTGSSKSLFNFLILIKKIPKCQNLKTGPHGYAMTKNLLMVECLQVFEKNYRAGGSNTTSHYDMIF